jgi:citrate synthase
MTRNSLSVTDNRTGKTYEIPIEHGGIRAVDPRQMKVGPDDFGLLSYDPAFMNTAWRRSTITYDYDPRATIIKRLAEEVFAVTRPNALLPVALALERIALQDEYFVQRKLYPNVDFYSGLIYRALGFPVDMFPVPFAIPRTSGWLAQWLEMTADPEQKIARPRQLYQGSPWREFVPLDRR